MIVIRQRNTNSISTKFNQLKVLALKHVAILVVCETKLDKTFPNSKFHIEGFSLPYRLDRNCNGGGCYDVCQGKYTKQTFNKT